MRESVKKEIRNSESRPIGNRQLQKTKMNDDGARNFAVLALHGKATDKGRDAVWL